MKLQPVIENIRMALGAIRVHKLRSALTLLGMSVGVLSIIGVMTAIGVLQKGIEGGLSVLGTNSFIIQKLPALHFDSQKQKYRSRKDISLLQGKQFEKNMKGARGVALQAWLAYTQVGYKTERTNPNVEVMGGSPQIFAVKTWIIQEGRSFTEEEVAGSQKVCVLGERVVAKLFSQTTHVSPIGAYVKIDGVRYRVIGTLEPKGSFLGSFQDNFAIIPITTGLAVYGKKRSIAIVVEAGEREQYQETILMAKVVLRTIRGLLPGTPDDFEVFSNDMLIGEFNNLTFIIKIVAAGIAAIALLAAGVGIMNIMLVSVTERTKEIGVRKALGATKRNILFQFLTESLVFCQLGGLIGIVGGSLLGNSLCLAMNIPPIMPWDTDIGIVQTPLLAFTALEINLLALMFCSLIGIVFGVYPAWKAANLHPIDALRYE